MRVSAVEPLAEGGRPEIPTSRGEGAAGVGRDTAELSLSEGRRRVRVMTSRYGVEPHRDSGDITRAARLPYLVDELDLKKVMQHLDLEHEALPKHPMQSGADQVAASGLAEGNGGAESWRFRS